MVVGPVIGTEGGRRELSTGAGGDGWSTGIRRVPVLGIDDNTGQGPFASLRPSWRRNTG